MTRRIYPNGGRSDCFVSVYCEMAMEAYYNAKKNCDFLAENGYSCENMEEYGSMNKAIIATVLFSAMAIEAFINDYAAACLGDSDFYDNFDRLSVFSKLELIARFILKTSVDKSKSYYSHLKKLFKERDAYVHSKSKQLSFCGYTLEEIEEIDRLRRLNPQKEYRFDEKEIKEDMQKAIVALKAIRDIADYFDAYDSNVHATIRMFQPGGETYGSEKEQQYKTAAFHMLGMRFDNYEI